MDPTRTPTVSLAERRLAWLENRQRVLAQNIANADTPGYQPRDLRPFAETLAHLHADAAAWTQVQRAGLAQVGREEDPEAYRAVLRRLCEAPTFP